MTKILASSYFFISLDSREIKHSFIKELMVYSFIFSYLHPVVTIAVLIVACSLSFNDFQ